MQYKISISRSEDVIKALRDGKVIRLANHPDVMIRMVDGFVVKTSRANPGAWSMNYTINFVDNPYVEEELPAKEGQLWKTAGGDVAKILKVLVDGPYVVIYRPMGKESMLQLDRFGHCEADERDNLVERLGC